MDDWLPIFRWVESNLKTYCKGMTCIHSRWLLQEGADYKPQVLMALADVIIVNLYRENAALRTAYAYLDHGPSLPFFASRPEHLMGGVR